MRILLVNYRYFISGGPEKYLFNVKKLLEDNGHEVIPFSVHSNKNVETKYSEYFVEPIGSRDAAYFEECQKTPRVVWQMISRSIYSFKVKRALQKEISDVKPDLVYILHYVNKLSPSVIRGAKEMGIPVVQRLSDYFLLCPTFHFFYKDKVCEDCQTKGYRSCIQKRCVKGSLFASLVRVISMKIHHAINVYHDVDAYITPSMFLKQKLIVNKFEEKKIHCIPTFTASITKTGEPLIGTYGLYFGRIDKEKGVQTVIQAYEKLPDYKVIIMGKDTTAEAVKLRKYVTDKNLKNIQFVGYKSGDALENIVKGARFTIIPSVWYDNLPNTALESFLYSKPVIASDIGSLTELVVDGYNGYLFKPGNVDELIQRIRQLYTDDTLVREMGLNSYTRLQKYFLPNSHYNALIKTFEQCIIRKKSD